MKLKAKREPLMVRVYAELGAGRLTEGYVHAKQEFVHGYIEDGVITVNPAPAVVDTCIHEILHRLFPEWSESYVTNRTTYLLRRMTDAEIQTFYEEFKRRARKRKKPVQAGEDS